MYALRSISVGVLKLVCITTLVLINPSWMKSYLVCTNMISTMIDQYSYVVLMRSSGCLTPVILQFPYNKLRKTAIWNYWRALTQQVPLLFVAQIINISLSLVMRNTIGIHSTVNMNGISKKVWTLRFLKTISLMMILNNVLSYGGVL